MPYGNPSYGGNHMLAAVVENDRSRLTITEDTMPRRGESELARIVRCYGIEFALDILEEGADVDGIVSTIRIDGSIFDTDDPMFDGARERNTMAITKTLLTSDLRETRVRWARLGRSIDRVCVIVGPAGL